MSEIKKSQLNNNAFLLQSIKRYHETTSIKVITELKRVSNSIQLLIS